MERQNRSWFRLLTYSFTAALLTGLAFALLRGRRHLGLRRFPIL